MLSTFHCGLPKKSWKSDEIGATGQNCKLDEPEEVMRRIDAIESDVFCKNRFTSRDGRGATKYWCKGVSSISAGGARKAHTDRE